MNGRFQRRHLVEVRLVLAPHKILTSLEAHLWQDLFPLQPSIDHQFFHQSTTDIIVVVVYEWCKSFLITFNAYIQNDILTEVMRGKTHAITRKYWQNVIDHPLRKM